MGSVSSIEDGVAHLSDGRKLTYDWLVLATGTKWPGPLSFPNGDDSKVRQSWIDGWRDKIAQARDIVIVGGGAVGIGEYIWEVMGDSDS